MIMANKKILPVVIIDFLSAARTNKFVADFRNQKTELKPVFIIVDNAGDAENQSKLTVEMRLCKVPGFSEGKVFCNTDEDIYVIIPGENLGFAKGNNVGFNLAQLLFRPQWVLFSNNDIQFTDGFRMDALIQDMINNPKIGVIGPKVVGLDGKPQTPCKELDLYQRWWKKLFLWPLDRLIYKIIKRTVIPSDLEDSAKSGQVYRLIGAFLLCDGDKFIQVGQFDECTFLYAEELILAERMRNSGYITYYESNVELIHEGGYTTKKKFVPISKVAQRLESELYYYEKYKHVNRFEINMTKLLFKVYKTKLWIFKR